MNSNFIFLRIAQTVHDYLGMCMVISCFWKALSKKMIQNKKNSHKYKWKRDKRDYAQTHSDRLVHFVVMQENNWTKSKTKEYKNDSTNEVPLPCNYQKNDQDKRWSEMNGEGRKLLPNS